MPQSKGASPDGDRATHERSLKSPPSVGIPSAEDLRYRKRLADEEWLERMKDAELNRGPYAGD